MIVRRVVGLVIEEIIFEDDIPARDEGTPSENIYEEDLQPDE